jgi:RNA polymerase sigma-70 factor, ECF subfamily
MNYKDNKENANSSKILPFSAEKQPSQLPIDIGDTHARQFYLKYYAMVKNRCMAILHNREDAQDMANDVFVYVLEKFKKEGQSSIPYPKTYLSRAADNMSINKKKRARREVNEIYNMATNGSIKWFIDRGGEGKEEWEAGIVDKGYEQVEAEIIVKAILDEQDETNRRIYFYKYHDDMTLEEIGDAVNYKKSAVHERLKALEEQVKVKMGRVGK